MLCVSTGSEGSLVHPHGWPPALCIQDGVLPEGTKDPHPGAYIQTGSSEEGVGEGHQENGEITVL